VYKAVVEQQECVSWRETAGTWQQKSMSTTVTDQTTVTRLKWFLIIHTVQQMVKGKVLQYSLASVGPWADPGVQEVRPLVGFKLTVTVGCHYFLLGPWSHSQPKNITDLSLAVLLSLILLLTCRDTLKWVCLVFRQGWAHCYVSAK